ncbi:MAG: hypothetical protein HY720_03020 [Planctomycetes bacterium]|nr:hypothetical protein [Planctomycetota bacterium]
MKAHTAATDAHHDAFKTEKALRDAHYMTVDKFIGLVRAAFPNDRVKQDVIFPEAAPEEAVTTPEEAKGTGEK